MSTGGICAKSPINTFVKGVATIYVATVKTITGEANDA